MKRVIRENIATAGLVADAAARGSTSTVSLSHYGENLLCVWNVCKELDGHYEVRRHQGRFLEKFGPNGSFKEDRDQATNDCVALLERGPLPPEESGSTANRELSALCCVPGLLGGLKNLDKLEKYVARATQVTHTHPLATSSSLFFALFMIQLIANSGDANIDEIFTRAGMDESIVLKIREGCAFLGECTEAAEKLGNSSLLEHGLPLSMWILQHSKSFRDAIDLNIRCGGDSCGRAIFIGPIAYAVWGEDAPLGLPQEWVKKLDLMES